MAKANRYSISNSDEHYTPTWVFDALNIVFDLDVASPEGGSNVPCKRYLTKHDDGLNTEWKGNVFMNPPFSETTKWADKFMSHRQGIALLPVSRSRWAEDMWNDDEIALVIINRIAFERPNEKPKKISYPVWLCAYGQSNIDAISRIGKLR